MWQEIISCPFSRDNDKFYNFFRESESRNQRYAEEKSSSKEEATSRKELYERKEKFMVEGNYIGYTLPVVRIELSGFLCCSKILFAFSGGNLQSGIKNQYVCSPCRKKAFVARHVLARLSLFCRIGLPVVESLLQIRPPGRL